MEFVKRCPNKKQGRICPCKRGNILTSSLELEKIVGYFKDSDSFEIRHSGLLNHSKQRVVLLAHHDMLYKRIYLQKSGAKGFIEAFEKRFKKHMKSSFRVGEDGKPYEIDANPDPNFPDNENDSFDEGESDCDSSIKKPEPEAQKPQPEVQKPGNSYEHPWTFFDDPELVEALRNLSQEILSEDLDLHIDEPAKEKETIVIEDDNEKPREAIIIEDDPSSTGEFSSDERLDLYLDDYLFRSNCNDAPEDVPQIQEDIPEEDTPKEDPIVPQEDPIVPQKEDSEENPKDTSANTQEIPQQEIKKEDTPVPERKVSPMRLLAVSLNPVNGKKWDWYAYMPRGFYRATPYDLRQTKRIRYN
jgi:hypothetical protein